MSASPAHTVSVQQLRWNMACTAPPCNDNNIIITLTHIASLMHLPFALTCVVFVVFNPTDRYKDRHVCALPVLSSVTDSLECMWHHTVPSVFVLLAFLDLNLQCPADAQLMVMQAMLLLQIHLCNPTGSPLIASSIEGVLASFKSPFIDLHLHVIPRRGECCSMPSVQHAQDCSLSGLGATEVLLHLCRSAHLKVPFVLR